MNTALVHKVATIVLIIGGLNLGLIGAFHFDAIGAVVHGDMGMRIVDIVIGVAAVVKLLDLLGVKI